MKQVKKAQSLKRKISCTIAAITLCAIIAYFIARPNRQMRILEPHIILSESRGEVTELFGRLALATSAHGLKGCSLSYFLLAYPPRKTWGCELAFIVKAMKTGGERFDPKLLYLDEHHEFLTFRDVSIKSWDEKQGGSFSGSFLFRNQFCNGRCLFEGKGDQLKRLVLAKRGSNNIDDGLEIYGDNFRCYLGNYLYDMTTGGLVLPKVSAGIFFVEGDANNEEFFAITINKEGLIRVNGTPFQSDEFEALRGWLDTHIQEFGPNSKVLLFADVAADPSLTKRIEAMAHNFHLPLYRGVKADGSNPKFPKGCLLGEEIK